MAFGTEIAGRVTRSGLGLLDGLAGSAAMAGTDPAGSGWAAAYDDAAAMTVGVTQDVANGCYQLAALLQQTGFNYGRAESWSTPGLIQAVPDHVAYASCAAVLGAAPSAAGGSSPVPSGWWLVEHAVGYVWPGGHQDKLRSAAAAWSAAALSIGEATLYVQDALECIASQVSPEVDDAMTACRAMDQHLWDLVAGYRAMAGACSDFASHIDQAHSDVEHELLSLLEWSAGIQLAGGGLAYYTFGLSELGAQGAQAARVGAAVLKVRGIIVAFIKMIGVLSETITAASARIVEVSRNLKGLLGARISVATAEEVGQLPAVLTTAEKLAQDHLVAVAKAAKTPKMTMSRHQIEKKFKHAGDFGVRGAKGASGYKEFADTIERFINDPATIRVFGTYRKQPAVLSYNTSTRLVVAQWPDGEFICGWHMSEEQMRNVIERRSLGGG
ncbi:MAG: colicin D domain-containing protein [Pseudonocardiales bacterium]